MCGRGRVVHHCAKLAAVVAGAAALAGPASASDFAPPLDRPAPSLPRGLAVADFNRDGRADVAAAQEASGGVSALLNTGGGVLGAPVTRPTADRAYGVAAADFDLDGAVDLAVANLGTHNVSVLRGVGDGTFGGAVHYPAGTAPVEVEAGDVNRDGRPDLAVVNNGTESSSVSVLFGHGDGTFHLAQDVPVGENYPHEVALGDFNADSNLDMAVSVSHARGVTMLLGSANGTFGPPVIHPLPPGLTGSPHAITAADLNADGRLDVAITASSRVWTYLGRGDGSLAPANGFTAHPSGKNAIPTGVASADFNGDRRADLAVANNGTTDQRGNVTVLHGAGDGTFGPPFAYEIPATQPSAKVDEVGPGPNAVAASDLSGDGRPDLAVSHGLPGDDPGGVAVLVNNGAWPVTDPAPPARTTRKRPRLRISGLRVRQGRVRVVVRRRRAARGTVRVYVRRAGRPRGRVSRSRRAVSRHRFRLRPGRHRLQVRFKPATGEWRAVRLKPRRIAVTR